jgi:hypothetical protein
MGFLSDPTYTADSGILQDANGNILDTSTGFAYDASGNAITGPFDPASFADPTINVNGANPLALIPSTESAYGVSGAASGTLYDPTTGKIVPAAQQNTTVQAQSTWASILGFVGLGTAVTKAVTGQQTTKATGSQRVQATTKTSSPTSPTMILLAGAALLIGIIAFGRR